jgi:SPP1 family predicted phage head-tail adaptor
MQAGSMNRYIEVLRNIVTVNEYGEPVNTYTPLYKIKAQVKYLSGNKTISAKEIFFSSKVSFTVRSQYKIDDTDRIKYNDKLYAVDYITESEQSSKTIITDLINE